MYGDFDVSTILENVDRKAQPNVWEPASIQKRMGADNQYKMYGDFDKGVGLGDVNRKPKQKCPQRTFTVGGDLGTAKE